ncbi:MAG: hydantoinase/oxoprolinase family protein [Gammaproteobacteria bacterium]|nr:hydantoinase/oxoprolinase family protein [Gammaproteobacteria bacterium]
MTLSWLGVDTGGTFTDFVFFNGESIKIHKVLSTPSAPEKAILQGIRELGLTAKKLRLIHGSTVATNAVLEGKGVRTAYITNTGFADVLQIGRQARAELYNLQPQIKPALIPSDLCLEVDTRLSAEGVLTKPLSQNDLQRIGQQIDQLKPQAVAINLLFSFLDDAQEKQIASVIADDIFVSRSSDVLAEYKEYERGMTTCLNAYVGPLMQGYLQRLEKAAQGAAVSVMQSAGGTISAQHAGQHAVHLLLSGPAGGLKGAQYVAGLSGFKHLLSFDMGGTSTDVALIDEDISLTSEAQIGDYPVAVPMVDMHTIGAGGGSIARVDAGGMLLVGPESAGADPGPACYGQGGRQATVTDANLVLGRLQPAAFLGGDMSLDVAAARTAVGLIANQLGMGVEQTAEGIIQLANEHMVRALRVMSVQRGIDPAEFVLASFGGAGGLHVCALAEALEVKRAIVPIHAGVLSALGMLVAAPSRELSRTITQLLSVSDVAQMKQYFLALEQKALEDMRDELAGKKPTTLYSLDLRYKGQSFTLNISCAIDDLDFAQIAQKFNQKHKQRYGHALNIPVELVNIRVSVRGEMPPFKLPAISNTDSADLPADQVTLYGVAGKVNVYRRAEMYSEQSIAGPALIIEKVSTTYVAKDWLCRVDNWGNLILDANR